MKKIRMCCLMLCLSLLLAGCGEDGSVEGQSGTADDPVGSSMDSGDVQNNTIDNPAYNPGDRQVLTAVVTSPFGSTLNHIRDFNRSNPTYFIETKEYGSYTDADAAMNLETQLTLEILSGEGPDLVIWDYNLYTPSLASERLMENLYDFMEADPDFHKEDYYENILQAFELNGGLYILPASFSVDTLCGKAEELGPDRGATESWELGEMLEAYESSPHAELFSIYYNREYTLDHVCESCLNNFVDWSSGECHFDTPEFVELLEFCKNLPDGFEGLPESFYESCKSGETFLYSVTLNTPWKMAEMRFAFDEDVVCWPGYPVANGEKALGGGVAAPRGDCLSICRNSSNQEGAWEFIKSYLTVDAQRVVTKGIPLLRSVSEEKIQEALTVEYETVDGIEQEKNRYEIVLSESGATKGFACITESEAEMYRNIIENTYRSSGKDSGIMDIIKEEAAAYFENDKDAATAADIIQRRVSVYVSERM